MKRIKIFIITITLIGMTLLPNCFVDFYTGKRPIDYPNTRWVSENPDIYFEVTRNGEMTYGQITIDGDAIEIIVSFDYGTGIDFYDLSAYTPPNESNRYGAIDGTNWLFWGSCKFGKDKLIVTIKKNREFLDDSIKKIIFVREDL